MSIVMNLAPLVDITLPSNIFTVSRLAGAVPQSMSMLILLPLTVSLVRKTSSFCGRTLHNILPLVTSFHLSFGISDLFTKYIVLVPIFLPDVPWASLPISLSKEYVSPCLLCFCLLMRCRYSSSSPVYSSSTAAAKSTKNCKGYWRLATLLVAGQLLFSSAAVVPPLWFGLARQGPGSLCLVAPFAPSGSGTSPPALASGPHHCPPHLLRAAPFAVRPPDWSAPFEARHPCWPAPFEACHPPLSAPFGAAPQLSSCVAHLWGLAPFLLLPICRLH